MDLSKKGLDSGPKWVLPILVGRETAALMIEVSVRTIDYLIKRKKLKTRRIGRRVLIEVASLRRLARDGYLGPLSE